MTIIASDPRERLRDDGADAVTAADPHFFSIVSSAIGQLAGRGKPFTVEDVRELVIAEPKHVNSWGAAFNIARREQIIRQTGWRIASRKVRHCAPIREWVGN